MARVYTEHLGNPLVGSNQLLQGKTGLAQGEEKFDISGGVLRHFFKYLDCLAAIARDIEGHADFFVQVVPFRRRLQYLTVAFNR